MQFREGKRWLGENIFAKNSPHIPEERHPPRRSYIERYTDGFANNSPHVVGFNYFRIIPAGVKNAVFSIFF
jgi:hypothetical protein